MGQHETSQDVQNRFTAYLLISLARKKRDYQKKQARARGRELLTDFQNGQYEDYRAYGMPDWPRHTPQSECSALIEALSGLTERERYIIFERVLMESGYSKLADSMNLQYSGAVALYRRAIRKLKRALGEGHK